MGTSVNDFMINRLVIIYYYFILEKKVSDDPLTSTPKSSSPSQKNDEDNQFFHSFLGEAKKEHRTTSPPLQTAKDNTKTYIDTPKRKSKLADRPNRSKKKLSATKIETKDESFERDSLESSVINKKIDNFDDVSLSDNEISYSNRKDLLIDNTTEDIYNNEFHSNNTPVRDEVDKTEGVENKHTDERDSNFQFNEENKCIDISLSDDCTSINLSKSNKDDNNGHTDLKNMYNIESVITKQNVNNEQDHFNVNGLLTYNDDKKLEDITSRVSTNQVADSNESTNEVADSTDILQSEANVECRNIPTEGSGRCL